jgi:nucleoid DNA-binding protein
MANTTELANRLAVRLGLSKTAAIRMVEDVLQEMALLLAEDRMLKLRGFGTLKQEQRPARRSYLVNNGKVGLIPSSETVRFRPSPELIKLLVKMQSRKAQGRSSREKT